MSQGQEPGHDSHEHPHHQLEHPHPHHQLEHPHQQLEHPHQQLQQPLQQLQQAAVPSLQSSDNQFVCLWNGCSERAANAEALYEHVCDVHIGRKSTNNLNLTCGWGSCRVTVVKRDHITSHIRVHVPLKPHRCEFCGKCFKRPQDLKKHVKTHADDSVLVPAGANGANRGQQNGQQNGYNAQQQQKTQNFYPGQQQVHPNMSMSYPQHQPHNGQGYYAPPPTSQAYGNVDYGTNQGGEVGNQASMESTKYKLEVIGEIVRDVQNGTLDTSSYPQMASRLEQLGSSNPQFHAGSSIGQYQAGGGSPGGEVYGPTSQYPLPAIPNLRTKRELEYVDHLFQNVTTTMYENPSGVAMAHRQSHSPPGVHLSSAHGPSYVPNMGGQSPQSQNSGNSAISPPSSAHSYTTNNSLPEHRGSNNLSRAPPAAMYPTLPGASSDMAGGYISSNTAPTSTLGLQFDDGHRHRHSGGTLQKAQPIHGRPRNEDTMDTTGDSPKTQTPTTLPNSTTQLNSSTKTEPRHHKVDFSSSNLDPALGGIASSPTGEIDEAAIKGNEMWLGNLRTVESIRTWIKQRLDSHDYENEDGEDSKGRVPEMKEEVSNLYPVLAGA